MRVAAHHGRNALHDREHRRDIRNVVDEGRDDNGAPDDDGVHAKEALAAELDEQGADVLNDARLGQRADDDEQAHEKQERFKVNFAQRVLDGAKVLFLENGADEADEEQRHADQAVRDGGTAGDEGRRDEQRDRADQQVRREQILHDGRRADRDLALFLAEDEHDNGDGHKRAQLNGKEDGALAVQEDEVQKIHVGVAAQHDGRRIADERRRALQVGRDGDADEQCHRGHLQLFRDGQRDRRDHQNRCDVVDKRRHDAREHGQRHRDPHDVGRLLQKEIGHALRHFRLDKQRDRAHRTGEHQKNVPVDGRKDGGKRHRAGDDEDDGGDERDIGTFFRQRDHQNVGDGEEDDGEQLHDGTPNVFLILSFLSRQGT